MTTSPAPRPWRAGAAAVKEIRAAHPARAAAIGHRAAERQRQLAADLMPARATDLLRTRRAQTERLVDGLRRS